MKTTVNTGKVSLPPAQEAAWGLKISDDEANVTERLRVLETAKWIAKPDAGRIIMKTIEKLNLRHEHQVKWEIPEGGMSYEIKTKRQKL